MLFFSLIVTKTNAFRTNSSVYRDNVYIYSTAGTYLSEVNIGNAPVPALPVNPVSFFLFPPLLLLGTVGNLLKHCPHRTFKLQHTLLETVDLVTMPRNFWHWSVSDIDLRQIGACCACSKCGTFLFAPLMVIVLWPQYREKIAQQMLRTIAALHFPICALKSCPAPAALAAGAGHYFSITAYNLTF